MLNIKKENKTETLTIRMTPTDSLLFKEACKELKVSMATLLVECTKLQLNLTKGE